MRKILRSIGATEAPPYPEKEGEIVFGCRLTGREAFSASGARQLRPGFALFHESTLGGGGNVLSPSRGEVEWRGGTFLCEGGQLPRLRTNV
jgi:hypothetical protein